MQTVLFEVEMILNNRPLTYVYTDKIENALTPNNLLFSRILTSTTDQNKTIQFSTQLLINFGIDGTSSTL